MARISPLLLGHERLGRGLVGALGGEPELDALDAAGEVGEGGVAGSVEHGDAAGQPLGQARLALAPGAQRAAEDGGGARPPAAAGRAGSPPATSSFISRRHARARRR